MALQYIADGFQYDADLLLNEFALEKSSEFQVFTSIWKKKNFSFIYMGRENVKELGEFTNEIFSLSSNYLVNESEWKQIGGVFLLYALYRNQILNYSVRIRVELAKYEIMKRLLDKAIADKLHSLHYVLEYLFKNAFEMVASPILLGPGVRIFDKSKSEFEKKLRMSAFKCNLEELMENKVLEDLSESFLKYGKLKPTPRNSFTKSRSEKLISIMNKLAVDQMSIEGNGNNLPAPINIYSRLRFRRGLKKVRREYPFLDNDVNQISDEQSGNESDYVNENFGESESLDNSMMGNKDGGQHLECNDQSDEIRVPIPKPRKLKNLRRRVEKTRRIRKYYEGSPTKGIVCTKAMLLSSVDVLLRNDSEDELL